jgi:hypothetical protein
MQVDFKAGPQRDQRRHLRHRAHAPSVTHERRRPRHIGTTHSCRLTHLSPGMARPTSLRRPPSCATDSGLERGSLHSVARSIEMDGVHDRAFTHLVQLREDRAVRVPLPPGRRARSAGAVCRALPRFQRDDGSADRSRQPVRERRHGRAPLRLPPDSSRRYMHRKSAHRCSSAPPKRIARRRWRTCVASPTSPHEAS